MCLSFFICLFLGLCLKVPQSQAEKVRIVGGVDVTDFSKFSYQVSVRRNGGHSCGGSILDERHVLTAAHCCVEEDDSTSSSSVFSVGFGSALLSQLKLVPVQNVFVHEKWTSKNLDNDICILRVKSKLSGSFVSLARSDDSFGICTVSGWGYLRDNGNSISRILQAVDITYRDSKTCKSIYSSTFTSNMICAGDSNKDSCQGDSGGPLVCNGRQAGIVSWGYGCAKPGYYGVYTKVSNYLQWIDTQKKRSKAAQNSVNFVLFLITSSMAFI